MYLDFPLNNHIEKKQNKTKKACGQQQRNRPIPGSPMPLFENESTCETFHMKTSSACSFVFMQTKVIFVRMVSHLDSLWNRGTRELGNGLFYPGRDTCTFEFDQGQVTKNQPITVLIWLSESLTICDLQNQFTAGKKIKKIIPARVDP